MLLIKHTPGIGWGAPEIVPYGPLSLVRAAGRARCRLCVQPLSLCLTRPPSDLGSHQSPASAVFHYAPSLFEGEFLEEGLFS